MKLFELFEDVELYHGGKDLELSYYDMIPSKSSRWEFGPGLLFNK